MGGGKEVFNMMLWLAPPDLQQGIQVILRAQPGLDLQVQKRERGTEVAYGALDEICGGPQWTPCPQLAREAQRKDWDAARLPAKASKWRAGSSKVRPYSQSHYHKNQHCACRCSNAHCSSANLTEWYWFLGISVQCLTDSGRTICRWASNYWISIWYAHW